jgi:hypothetical protein
MGKNKSLRYGGFSFLARAFWSIENLETNDRVGFPKIIEKIDEVDFWTKRISESTREWFKEKARRYVTTQFFQLEKNRHRLRRESSGRGPFEKPEDWFGTSEILKPSDWGFVLGLYSMYEMLHNVAAEEKETRAATKREEEEEEAKSVEVGKEYRLFSDTSSFVTQPLLGENSDDSDATLRADLSDDDD